MCSDEEEDLSSQHHVQSSVKWADIETGIPPQQHEIEILEVESNESELPLISKAQTKLEHLLEPSNLVLEESSTSSLTTEADEIDTIEAHAELIKMREKLRLEKQQTMPDQPNPFLPDGEVAKDAQNLVAKMKSRTSGPKTQENGSHLEYESLSIESPEHSEDFASTDLNFEDDIQSPVSAISSNSTKNGVKNEESSSAVIVNHGLIISAKTDTVEHVVIPEKQSVCCCIIL